MPTPRKTIPVLTIVEKANHFLAESTGEFGSHRRLGVCSFVESILHMTDQYNGFGFLDADNVPHGEKPGIIWGFNPEGERDNNYNVYPDETRRVYYLKRG